MPNFVPFISSGTSSRLLYVLVRKVESAPVTQAADAIILAEMETIVAKLREPNLSTFLCREYLIILLYCINTSTLSIPALDGILPHAVNLAEAGQTVAEKRIGYLFCSETMPARHELQLMLVNTMRKDLESHHTSNICLALDHLIQCPSEDVIPAIQSRLQDLLAHSSPLVRRRALLAFKVLSAYEPDLMSRIQQTLARRIKDHDPSVCVAALIAAGRFFQIYEPARVEIQDTVIQLFRATWSRNYDGGERAILIRLLSTMQVIGLSDPMLTDVIKRAARRKDYVLIRCAFLCLSLPQVQAVFPSSPISHIRPFLTSRDTNTQYLFLTCLECLAPEHWAGTTPDVPAVLEQWEVEHIMRFLDSEDSVLRKKTLKILDNVDKAIVSSYYTSALQNLSNLPIEEKPERLQALLEVIEAREDGDSYARDAMDLLARVDLPSPDGQVLEGAVDMILTFIHQLPDDSQLKISTYILELLSDANHPVGPTTMVIMSALACESSGRISLSSVVLLKGLSEYLAYLPVPVQDACLLGMLRVSLDCKDIPDQVVAAVSKLREVSEKRVRRRCEQFLRLSSDKIALAAITQSVRSSTLPDFWQAVQKHQSNNLHSGQSSSREPAGSAEYSPNYKSESLPASNLRYAAYDAPVPTPRLQGRKSTNSNYASESSFLGSPRGLSSPRALAGGELTLAASTVEFERQMSTPAKPAIEALPRNDLIAFDSPFMSDLTAIGYSQEGLFDIAWERFNDTEARGWYREPMEQLLRQVQILDPLRLDVKVIEPSLPPFLGELKVMIKYKPQISTSSCAILRLKEGEEESCLWRLRGDMPLYETVKNILTEN